VPPSKKKTFRNECFSHQLQATCFALSLSLFASVRYRLSWICGGHLTVSPHSTGSSMTHPLFSFPRNARFGCFPRLAVFLATFLWCCRARSSLSPTRRQKMLVSLMKLSCYRLLHGGHCPVPIPKISGSVHHFTRLRNLVSRAAMFCFILNEL